MKECNKNTATTNVRKDSKADCIFCGFTLEMNLFFDGTANCWRNTQARLDYEKNGGSNL